MPDEEEQEIRELLEYPEESAGGIMTRELCAVDSEATAAEAIEELRAQAEESEDLYTVFVVGRRGRLRGVVNLRDLVLAAPETRISDLREEPPAVVSVDLDQEEVGRLLSRYNLAAIGVIDAEGRLVGQITFDDVIDVVEAEVTEDILRFAAVSDEEQLRGTTLGAIRSRLPWLAVNTLTLAVAAVAVWLYRGTIEQLAILAVVMPVIAGLGGNAGTQALAVTIRRIALADELPGERWSAVVKELIVGLVNGGRDRTARGARLAAAPEYRGRVRDRRDDRHVGEPRGGLRAGCVLPDPAGAVRRGPGGRVVGLRHDLHGLGRVRAAAGARDPVPPVRAAFDPGGLADRIAGGEPLALARGISHVENESDGFEALLERLDGRTGRARRIGITGPPGAGKSTLTAALTRHYLDQSLKVGIVAVDPDESVHGRGPARGPHPHGRTLNRSPASSSARWRAADR